MGMAVIIIVVVLGLVALIYTQVQARQQVDVEADGGTQHAAEIVQAYFGAIWTKVSGPAAFNYRPKLRLHAPTISISITSGANGNAKVSIWTSHYDTKLGGMYHAGLMWRKKRGLVKRLASEA